MIPVSLSKFDSLVARDHQLDRGGQLQTIPEGTLLRDVSVNSGKMPNYFSQLSRAARHPYFLKSKFETIPIE